MGTEKITEEIPKVKPFLERTLTRKRSEIAAADQDMETVRARAEARGPARSWSTALAAPGVSVVAEIKRRSPSAGRLTESVDPARRAATYEANGAKAVSVLTDAAFDGALGDLEAVAAAIAAPVLRKDFIVDPYQVWESRSHGADAILVIVAAVDDDALAAIAAAASEAGVGTLVEIHTPDEIERIQPFGFEVVGVNARDLRSLDVSPTRGLELVHAARTALGIGTILVAESGIRSALDVAAAREAGADAVLVGEHLMRAADPGVAVRDLVAGGEAS